jgi:hypothetical protein
MKVGKPSMGPLVGLATEASKGRRAEFVCMNLISNEITSLVCLFLKYSK